MLKPLYNDNQGEYDIFEYFQAKKGNKNQPKQEVKYSQNWK